MKFYLLIYHMYMYMCVVDHFVSLKNTLKDQQRQCWREAKTKA